MCSIFREPHPSCNESYVYDIEITVEMFEPEVDVIHFAPDIQMVT